MVTGHAVILPLMNIMDIASNNVRMNWYETWQMKDGIKMKLIRKWRTWLEVVRRKLRDFWSVATHNQVRHPAQIPLNRWHDSFLGTHCLSATVLFSTCIVSQSGTQSVSFVHEAVLDKGLVRTRRRENVQLVKWFYFLMEMMNDFLVSWFCCGNSTVWERSCFQTRNGKLLLMTC